MVRYPDELRRAVVTAMVDDGWTAREVVEALEHGRLPGYPQPFTMTPAGCRLWAREAQRRRRLAGEAPDHEAELARGACPRQHGMGEQLPAGRALQHKTAGLSVRWAAGDDVIGSPTPRAGRDRPAHRRGRGALSDAPCGPGGAGGR
jgi:hypothetical protein